MTYSALQRFILLTSYDARANVPRAVFNRFYAGKSTPKTAKDRENDLTRSLERLIDRGLLSGYGKRTPRRWFIESVRLTPTGRREARRVAGEQQRLPLRISKLHAKTK